MEYDQLMGITDPSTAKLFKTARQLAVAKTDDLQLFRVINTAKREQLVLARNAKFARIICVGRGHLQVAKNGTAYRVGKEFFENNPGFAGAVNRAINDRTPGVIVRKGDHALMGQRVYSPLHGV